ncbi:copper resistance CopC family protein [Lysinibacillus endophyticus]|uniref:Copper resistance protein CopC n=1 Tax=Ureibacillus endophyticus TaxID=1978490 RepID=A0A494Z957_9BACL|nr:copper resistance CopC family protein [Lysinibacillus endophyticus]RKQ19096.1 copper resistance protein CopC [Lysinibacillus endophyticus]
MKKILFFSFIFLLTFIGNAFAHTGLETSSPQQGEVVEEELKQIQLTFETKIEQGSTFTLQNSSGETIPVDNISVVERQLVGDIPTPLQNGDYKINWNIIGADGHLIEGEISFSVNVPEEETTVEETTEVEQAVEENEATTVIDANNEEPEQEKSNNSILIIAVVLIVIIIGSFLFMRRKK